MVNDARAFASGSAATVVPIDEGEVVASGTLAHVAEVVLAVVLLGGIGTAGASELADVD